MRFDNNKNGGGIQVFIKFTIFIKIVKFKNTHLMNRTNIIHHTADKEIHK